jgi:hypothetical protein
VLDHDQAAREIYGAGAGMLVLVRPDGYVGCRGDAGSALPEYVRG